MILVGNSRGNSKDMADHLLKAENEKVIVHEIRGFIGDDLHSAFQESHAASLATNAKQHLYSLSFNPPKYADVSTEQFEETINRAENRLGLTGQPRAIVFHHKRDDDGNLRKHAHCVWSRITEDARALQMSYDRTRLNKFSHELFLENGWELPRGFENKAERDPLNYTHSEYQQANRASKKVQDIKSLFQDAWAQSDTRNSFAAALLEQGYILARGDRRSFVAVDNQGEVYAVARYANVKTKDVRARFGEPENLPSVDEATEIASQLEPIAQSADQKPQREQSQIEKKLIKRPELVLDMITERESTFTRNDIAKTLSTHIHDAEQFQAAFDKVTASDNIVTLNADPKTPNMKLCYSTIEMLRLENKLINDAQSMAANSSFAIPKRHIEKAIHNQNADMQNEIGVSLSEEQENAIHHLTNDEQLTCVVGVAGAGKSTILNAAREAWEQSGHRVLGAALAGKATDGLQQSSGIKSRTLASFELSWANERNHLQRGDILVIDEAGMIGSRQMSRFINEARDKGVKLVLVGDAEQLQPIEAGAPFRAITERIDPALLCEVHRQKQNWQKQTSKDFALGETKKALNAYREEDAIEFADDKDEAIQALASDYLNDFWADDNPPSQIALAHRKIDVKAINEIIREARKEAGELGDAVNYKTAHGNLDFASGDRLLFTRNDRNVGVKNGMLGTIVKTGDGKLTIELDDRAENGEAAKLTISVNEYEDIDYGYATTIHKSQGTTVDKSYVLASNTMDRHLTYVALTRHKQETKLYADREEFANYNKLASTLSRKRQKQSTLDYVSEINWAPKRESRLNRRVQATFNTLSDSRLGYERTNEDLSLER